MNLKTNKLLVISLILIVGTFLLVMFSEDLGLGEETSPFVVFLYFIAFGLNIRGLILVINEKTKNGKKPLVGIIGNGILIIMFICLVFFAISKM
jgi:hypothetical protein